MVGQDQTPFCWMCGHVEEGHDHYNTVVVHDPHAFTPISTLEAPRVRALQQRVTEAESTTSTLREAARDMLEEVEGWPHGPAQESKRIPYDAVIKRLEALVRPSPAVPTGPSREQRLEGILRQIIALYYEFSPEGPISLGDVLYDYMAAAEAFLNRGDLTGL